MKRTWKTQLKQGTCVSFAALMLISPNGVINVKAADIEKPVQEKTSFEINNVDELAKTGKCIAKIISPSEIIWGVISSGTYNQLKKIGVNGLAKKIASKGVAWSIAVSVARCYIENKGK